MPETYDATDNVGTIPGSNPLPDIMKRRMRLSGNSAENESDCAGEIIGILFEWTGLATIVQIAPVVIVGSGNWISFVVDQAVSMNEVLGLHQPNGNIAFVPDLLNRSEGVRSRTSPSLHLTNCGSNENLTGHVDSYYYLHNPLGHLYEYFRKKTTSPAELLRRIYSGPIIQFSHPPGTPLYKVKQMARNTHFDNSI